MGAHLVDGKFQSDKYPTCPAGKVPLSTADPTAQDLLAEYAKRRRSVDDEFSDDLEQALVNDGYAEREDPTVKRLAAMLEELDPDVDYVTLSRGELDALLSRARPAPARNFDALAAADRLIVENAELRRERARLLGRQVEHLHQIARLSQTVPLDSEVAEALEQRGMLLAEIGTLRAALRSIVGEASAQLERHLPRQPELHVEALAQWFAEQDGADVSAAWESVAQRAKYIERATEAISRARR